MLAATKSHVATPWIHKQLLHYQLLHYRIRSRILSLSYNYTLDNIIHSLSQGIQLYIDVIEDDPVPGIFGINELTDSFALDIEPDTLAANSDTPLLVNGIGVFGFAFVALSFQLECQPGFIGGNCVSICTTDPCSNNGICIQSDTSFTCVCTGDFTGDTCETRIDDCEGVDCNSGTCVDGVMTFTCQCDAGYSGESCDQVITTTSTFIDVTIATPRNGVMPEIATTSTDTVQTFTTAATSSGNIVFVAGAVGGSVAVIITVVAIIIIIIATCCILSVRIRKDSIEGTINNNYRPAIYVGVSLCTGSTLVLKQNLI